MIHGANIPLAHPSFRRTFPWRVFVFLGCGAICALFGWFAARTIHLGGRVSSPENSQLHIALRLTPQTKYWLATHAGGIPLSQHCPIDAPTLISLTNPKRIIGSYEGSTSALTLVGKRNDDALSPWNTLYACNLSWGTPQKHALPTLQPVYLAAQGHRVPIAFTQHGVSLTQNTVAPKKITAWPQVPHLLYALPTGDADILNSSALAPYISTATAPVAIFAWESQNVLAWGMHLTQTVPEEELLALAYALSNETPGETSMTRGDDASYTAQTHTPLTLRATSASERVIENDNGNAVAWITTLDDGTHLFATESVSWNMQRPLWSVHVRDIEQYAPRTHHAPRTWFTALTQVTLRGNTHMLTWE